jgi:hypothetical protein
MARIIRIKIHYSHRSSLVGFLVLAVMVLGLSSYRAWGEGEAAAAAPQAPMAASASMRQYYLTKNFFNGAAALSICQEGYHMASMWEILEPSALKYNTDLGYTKADSGQGPPTIPLRGVGGWVRTGYDSDTSTTPGQGNCNAWDSDSSDHRGTHARLPTVWNEEHDIYVWETGATACNALLRVWCVADDFGGYIYLYLPIILYNHS